MVRLVCAAMVVVAVVSFQIGWKLRSRSAGQTGNTPGLQRAGAAPKAGPAQAFWSAFLGDDSAPIIVFADAVFLLVIVHQDGLAERHEGRARHALEETEEDDLAQGLCRPAQS